MRHKLKQRKLNRTSSHRKSLLRNLATSLLNHESIRTTLPKAKELRPYVEKIMTISKTENLSNRRKLLSVIKDSEVVKKLFNDIGQRIKNRNGGYTRIMLNGFRSGDKAPMAIIELVDQPSTKRSDEKDSNKTENKSDKTKNSKEELKADKEIKVETKKQTKEAKND